MNAELSDLLATVGICIGTAFALQVTKILKGWNTRKENEMLRTSLVRGGVEAVWQHDAKRLKQAAPDGKLSDIQKERLRSDCRHYVEMQLMDLGLSIEEVFKTPEVLDGYINLEVNRRKGFSA